MKMENSNAMAMFKNRISQWVKYSEYAVLVRNGRKYIIPAPNARMSIYDPLANAEEMVTSFLNYGKELHTQKSRKRVMEISLEIASKYGLIGWMTALPKDPSFFECEETYLGINGLLFGNRRIMETKEYIDFFTKHNSKRHDPEIAYFMRRDDIYDVVFSARYMEPLAWGTAISENLYAHFLRFMQKFNNGSEPSPDGQPEDSDMSMTYAHPGISLQMWAEDSPEMLWCFDSLKTMVEVAYCTFLSADTHPLRVCKHCGKIYYHTHSRNEFCSPRCRNQWNVYRSRERTSIKQENPHE